MVRTSPTVTISVRVAPEVKEQLDELSSATNRKRAFLAAEAIEQYLSAQLWQVQAIESAVKKADGKNAKFVDHDAVADWVDSWNSEDEKHRAG